MNVKFPVRACGSRVVAVALTCCARRKPSYVKKKNALFLSNDGPPSPNLKIGDGPLILPPNSFLFKNAFGIAFPCASGVALLKNELDANFELRLNANRLP